MNLDMVGIGYAIDAFGKVMAPGGAGLIISSQTGYMYPLPYETEQEILNTPTEKLTYAELNAKANRLAHSLIDL